MTSGYRTVSTLADSGATAVSSFTITVPAGTVSTDTLYVFGCVSASTSRVVTASPGTWTARLSDRAMATFSRGFVLESTGLTAGDVVTFSITGGTGQVSALMAVYENVTTDQVGAAGATAGTASAPATTTTVASEIAIAFGLGVSGSTKTLSSVSAGTIRASGTGGGSTRWMPIGVSDQIITTAGSTGAVTFTFNAAAAGSTGLQLTATDTSGGGGGPSGIDNVFVAGAPVAATPNVSVAGTWTPAVRRVSVAGAWVP